jgi:hypothetical protein
MEDPDVLVRGRTGAAVTKIIDTDFNFHAEGSPADRAQKISLIRRFAENLIKQLPTAEQKFKPKPFQGK